MDFVGPYDKQAAKQYQPGLSTPLGAGWEFRQKPTLPTSSAGWMRLAKIRNWQLTATLRQGLLANQHAVVITDSEQVIQYVNSHFEQMAGYFSHEVIGQQPGLLQGTDTSLLARKHIRQALEQHKPVDGWLLNYRKDQTTYWCQIEIWPVVNRRKELVNFIAFEQETQPDGTLIPW